MGINTIELYKMEHPQLEGFIWPTAGLRILLDSGVTLFEDETTQASP
jgi:hypothetical protein